jgi:hypothetical protein
VVIADNDSPMRLIGHTCSVLSVTSLGRWPAVSHSRHAESAFDPLYRADGAFGPMVT